LRDREEDRRRQERGADHSEVRHPLEGEPLQRPRDRPGQGDREAEEADQLPGGALLGGVGSDEACRRLHEPVAEIDDDGGKRPDVEEDVEEDARLSEAGSRLWARARWAVDETGRNSVSPCRIPSRIACPTVMDINGL